MTVNATELSESVSQEKTDVTISETQETLNSELIFEEIEQPSNPWDNAPEGVIFYREIKDNGQIVGFTIGAELAYKIGLSLDNYLTFDDIQQSDKDFKYYLKDQCPMKSDDDLQKEAYQQEIISLKKQLSDTDYKAIKFAEGELSESDYQEVKLQRHDARVRINELESLIEELEKGNNSK